MSGREPYAALLEKESGRAPGTDGLQVKIYKAFWAVVGENLLVVLNESLAEGSFPLSCRRAVITLLPKKKKTDLHKNKNWQPVHLLCSNFKVFPKTLANRLKKVMEQIIHVDQTYCVPGRSIMDNVCLIRDVFEVWI